MDNLKFGRSSKVRAEVTNRCQTRCLLAIAALVVAGLFFWFPAIAQNAYRQHNLVSDVVGLADHTDPNLLNPWGIAFGPTSPFWLSDNHTGFSTLYDGSGAIQALVVTVPPAAGSPSPGAPTGIIFNNTPDFLLASNTPARFIFAGEDGTISAWASGTNAELKSDRSASGTIYKGLSLASNSGSNYLYAVDFHNGKVDVFDGAFTLVAMAGGFVDTNIPAGFAPFNVQGVGSNLFVTYAKQDANAEDDVQGPGNGYVNVFDTSGNLLRRFASNGPLNSPWGMAMAPTGYGQFGGELLIGNFGDGRINAFDPVKGDYLGSLTDTNGVPIVIEGLWGLIFGNGGRGGETNALYFSAGIAAGGGLEDHGLFGSIAVVFPIRFGSISATATNLTVTWSGGIGPYKIQKKTSLSATNWQDVTITTNLSAVLTKDGAAGFFRISD